MNYDLFYCSAQYSFAGRGTPGSNPINNVLKLDIDYGIE